MHLRPHPTQVARYKNAFLKHQLAERTSKYTYAFNDTNYCDFNVFNIHKKPSADLSGVGNALRTSKKPVVFFLTYDVGFNRKIGIFIRHIVCCVAYPSARKTPILFFEMRNLRDISPGHQQFIEKEIETLCDVPEVSLINLACQDKCIYLQRFKSEYEIGWCVAWSLFFLDFITKSHEKEYLPDMTMNRQLKLLAELYRDVDKTLGDEESNQPIERWYTNLLKSYQLLKR